MPSVSSDDNSPACDELSGKDWTTFALFLGNAL